MDLFYQRWHKPNLYISGRSAHSKWERLWTKAGQQRCLSLGFPLALRLQSWRLEKGALRKENQNDTAARRQQTHKATALGLTAKNEEKVWRNRQGSPWNYKQKINSFSLIHLPIFFFRWQKWKRNCPKLLILDTSIFLILADFALPWCTM